MTHKTYFWGAFWAIILLLSGGYAYLSLKAQFRFALDDSGALYVADNCFQEYRQILPNHHDRRARPRP